jgi:predicted nucleotidyltransferase
MESTMKSEIRYEMPTLADHPIILWFKQKIRKIVGRSPLQESVLDSVIEQATADENVIGILLFGSVATKTHKWQSDIDMIFIYDSHEPASGLVDYFVSGILVQYFYATLETLIENQRTVPYLLHMFSEADILFDRNGTVTPVVNEIKQYFATHPDIEAEWLHIKELHQVEKKGSQCEETTIIQRWDELEEKYSGGTRKRTFFMM